MYENVTLEPREFPRTSALYAFQAETAEQLSVNKGDILEVLDCKEDWSRVRNVDTEEEGYIPSTYLTDFSELSVTDETDDSLWCLDIEHDEAVTILRQPHNSPGTFLFRRRRTVEGIMLSVKDTLEDGRPNIKNIIVHKAGGWFRIIEEREFKCIEDLIEYYTNTTSQEIGLKLTKHLATRRDPSPNDIEDTDDDDSDGERCGSFSPGDSAQTLSDRTSTVVHDDEDDKNRPDSDAATEDLQYYDTADDLQEYDEVARVSSWWFEIDKTDADRLLRLEPLPKGTFLLRPSTDSSMKTISIRNFSEDENGQVMHYRIQITHDNFFIKGSKRFSNLEELIEYYQNTTGPHHICCKLHRPLRDVKQDQNTRL